MGTVSHFSFLYIKRESKPPPASHASSLCHAAVFTHRQPSMGTPLDGLNRRANTPLLNQATTTQKVEHHCYRRHRHQCLQHVYPSSGVALRFFDVGAQHQTEGRHHCQRAEWSHQRRCIGTAGCYPCCRTPQAPTALATAGEAVAGVWVVQAALYHRQAPMHVCRSRLHRALHLQG